MRAGLLDKLDEQIDGGNLALLGSVHTAISALDAEGEPQAETQPLGRVVLADDGQAITLSIYMEETATGATLTPERAIALAGELITAAQRRLR
jgi:hypothetical protein